MATTGNTRSFTGTPSQVLVVVRSERRPYILNVHIPSFLPDGGRPAPPFQLG